MSIFLVLAFLFFIGSLSGWVLELIFRRFFAKENSEKKWINPGFCTGPYLPLYGCGLCLLYLIASLETIHMIQNPYLNKIMLFIVMAIAMTVIEYIAGIISLKVSKVRLWDYSGEFGNIQGIICPKFSFFWSVLGAVYYFCIHNHILIALEWLSNNLAFSFVIGMFFGVFIVDLIQSSKLLIKLKEYADENQIIIHYEAIKAHIHSFHERNKVKYSFFHPFRTTRPLSEYVKELKELLEANRK